MKLRNAVIYRYKSFAPFLVAVVVFSVLQYVLTKEQNVPTVDFALAIAKCIFFFAFGIKSFKTPYKYLIQNGYKNTGIYESFIWFMPSTLIVSVIINVVSYWVKSQNDYFTQIFADSNFGLVDMKAFLVFKIITCFATFALSLVFGYVCAMMLYRLDGKLFKFFSILLGAVMVVILVLFTIFADSIGLLRAHFIPAITMLLIPLTVIFISLGYLLSTRIELERSRS